jgi:hypothetical protein
MSLNAHLAWNLPVSCDHVLTLLISTMKMEAVCSYKRLPSTDKIKQCHSPDEQNLELESV